MSHLYLLDLDRTVFNTEQFLIDVLSLLAETHGADPATFRAHINRFRDGEFYDFYGQIKTTLGLNQPDFDQLVGSRLDDQSYTYHDVQPWLAARAVGETVAVVTVGQQPFQSLKLRHARALDGLSQTIVPTNKGALIARELQRIGDRYRLGFIAGDYDAISLVDDNPVTFAGLGRPTPVTTYHMARPQETYSTEPTPSGTIRITDFTQLMV
jgi:hypothetical protein